MRQAISALLAIKTLWNMPHSAALAAPPLTFVRGRGSPFGRCRRAQLLYNCPTIVRFSRGGWQAMSNPQSWEFDFGLGETLDEIRREVRRFAVSEIAPLADELDR